MDIYASSRNSQACSSLVPLLLLSKAIMKAWSTCMEHEEDAHLLPLPTTSLANQCPFLHCWQNRVHCPTTEHSGCCSDIPQLGRPAVREWEHLVISMGKNRHGHLLLFFMVSFTTKTECSRLISTFKKGKPQPPHSTAVLLESTSRDLHLLLSSPARQHGCHPLLRNKHTFVFFFPQKEGNSKQTKTKGRRNRVLCMMRVAARWRTGRGGTTTTRQRKGPGQDAAVSALPRINLPDPVPDSRQAASLRTSMVACPVPPRAPLLPAPGALRGKAGRCCSRAQRRKGERLAGVFSFASKKPNSYGNKI